MQISLHKNARTTPAVRAQIAASNAPAAGLAEQFGVSVATIYKWRSRDSVHDRSHTAHRLQTTLTPAQEAIVVHLRTTLLLPLDDLLAVTREFICEHVSRSGLDRCLRRHNVSDLNALKPAVPKAPHKAFKAYEPGFIHIDVKYLPQMANESRRRYLFVAIDRAGCTSPSSPRRPLPAPVLSSPRFTKPVQLKSPRSLPITAKSSQTDCSPLASAWPPANMSSICCAPHWA
jgi:transposase-like protein